MTRHFGIAQIVFDLCHNRRRRSPIIFAWSVKSKTELLLRGPTEGTAPWIRVDMDDAEACD